MNRYLLTAIVALAVLLGATAAVTAQPGTGEMDQGDGPPAELPEPVPEFVTDLLGAISDFINGAITALGEALTALTPGAGGAPPGSA